MAGPEDIELVRKGYDAFIAGDMEWMNEHLHENIVWHIPGNSPFAGDHKGREAVLAFFAKSVAFALPEFQLHDIAAGEDHVVALVNTTWKRNSDGAIFNDQGVTIYHVDGVRALEAWTIATNQAGFDAFAADA
jgi:ketosteroid isomerase-like protein